MPDDDVSTHLKNLWAEMRRDPFQISPERLRKDAKGLKTRMRVAFVVYSINTLLLTSMIVLMATRVRMDMLSRIGFGVSSIAILGGAFALIHRLEIWPTRSIRDAGQTDCIRFFPDHAGAGTRSAERTVGIYPIRNPLPGSPAHHCGFRQGGSGNRHTTLAGCGSLLGCDGASLPEVSKTGAACAAPNRCPGRIAQARKGAFMKSFQENSLGCGRNHRNGGVGSNTSSPRACL